jgi:signal transduction histidine kinase/DNA-binding response OmpR family regulator
MAILGEKEYDTEYRIVWPDGSIHNLMALATVIRDGAGRPTHMIGTNWDITKEKKNEEALVKSKQEADAANKAKSTFLANMSHEIRTPLNAIIGFSQLMDRNKHLTGELKEYASSISRAGEHLLLLINDILELSKVEAGKVVLKPSNFDLHTLLDDLDVIFKDRIQSKHLSLTFETAPEVPRYVVADEGKMLQVFINLIGNAVKFTDQGGIVVRTKVEQFNGETTHLIVEVQDTGSGIAQDEMDKVFKTFEQTSSGIKQGSGTGLGLALCRELTILMGGNIAVASEVGKGSVFTFHVVIKGGDVVGVKTKTAKRVVGMAKGQKAVLVLVVDDKEENLKVAVDFLRLAGFETAEATNGKDAIAKFEESNPDLILMDFRMPVMDGYEAVQRIRSTEMGKLVPIVAISASMFDGEEIKIKMLDLQGFIHKPFREDEFYGTIGKVLGIQYFFEEETTLTPTDYLYDEDTASVDISKLPEGIQLNLRKAAEMADSDLMVEILNSNIIVNQELANHLMRVANNFEWDYLHRILKNT